LITHLYDRINTLEAEKKTAAEQFETQLKITPEHWLTDVLARWPTHPPDKIVELLPNRWKSSPWSGS